MPVIVVDGGVRSPSHLDIRSSHPAGERDRAFVLWSSIADRHELARRNLALLREMPRKPEGGEPGSEAKPVARRADPADAG